MRRSTKSLRAALDPLDRHWEAVFVDDGSTDGSFAALTRSRHRAERQGRPPAAQLRQGGRARCRLRVRRRRRRRHHRATCRTIRPRSRACWQARRRLRPGVRLEGAAARSDLPPDPISHLQRCGRPCLGPPPARSQLRPQGLPRRRRAEPAGVRRCSPSLPARPGPRSGLPSRRAPGQPSASWPREVAVRRRALPTRFSSTSSRSGSWAATGIAPCISSAGSALRWARSARFCSST